MNLNNIRSTLGRHWYNIPGWRTNRKIVVFESDDWGSIRMPSREVYEKLLIKGIRVDNSPFSKYDSLASEEDLIALFEILKCHTDFNGNSPVLTANTIVANPNFKKILTEDFNVYHYELFTETLKRYPKHHKSIDLWKEGMNEKLFYPQLHGREHLNISRWLQYLKAGSKETRLTFETEMYGISTTVSSENRRSYMSALDYDDVNELENQRIALSEAQESFNKIFGYKSASFIATNYTWSSALNQSLSSIGVKFLQGGRRQILPIGEYGKTNYLLHYLGEKNEFNQHYLIRNCFFEPSSSPNKDVVSECLNQIETAFLWKKPAIIGTHRLNFVGFIDENNRKKSLFKLNRMLKAITKKWPEVEFLTSVELGELIENDR